MKKLTKRKQSPNQLANLKKGKPFVKGDPRINYKGRASNFDQLRTFLQEMANEEIDDDGVKKTRLRMIAESLSENQLKDFLEFAYGKVPQPIDVKGQIESKVEIVNPNVKTDEL